MQNLEALREAMIEDGYAVKMQPGAKVFVRPDQYSHALSVIRSQQLHPYHVVVSDTSTPLVPSILAKVRLNPFGIGS